MLNFIGMATVLDARQSGARYQAMNEQVRLRKMIDGKGRRDQVAVFTDSGTINGSEDLTLQAMALAQSEKARRDRGAARRKLHARRNAGWNEVGGDGATVIGGGAAAKVAAVRARKVRQAQRGQRGPRDQWGRKARQVGLDGAGATGPQGPRQTRELSEQRDRRAPTSTVPGPRGQPAQPAGRHNRLGRHHRQAVDVPAGY